MKPVTRGEILELGAYEAVREHFRARVIAEKKLRRVALGPNMSAVFENHDTALLQIQEMLRTERITAEKAVLHEIETYNELVPGDRELSLTIFVEYDERAEREVMLQKLAGLEDKFYALIAGERFAATPDPRNDRRDRTTAVHYVKIPLSAAGAAAVSAMKPVWLGVAHPEYTYEVELPVRTVGALAEDLTG